MDRLYIIMPAYNEEETIQGVVRGWHQVVRDVGEGSRLVVVDDGSRDRTPQILQALLQPLDVASLGAGLEHVGGAGIL